MSSEQNQHESVIRAIGRLEGSQQLILRELRSLKATNAIADTRFNKIERKLYTVLGANAVLSILSGIFFKKA